MSTNWIGDFIVAYGLWAIFLLLFLENVFPVLPSEVVIPLAGFEAARNGMPMWEVITAASIGAMLGQMPWYWTAKALGYERFKRFASRFGRLTTIGPEEVDRASAWFARHGPRAVFFGRMVPVIRGVISIPAGLTSMPLSTFLAWSIPGSTLWVIGLAWAGYELGDRFPEVAEKTHVISNILIGLALLFWLYRIVTFRRSAGRN